MSLYSLRQKIQERMEDWMHNHDNSTFFEEKVECLVRHNEAKTILAELNKEIVSVEFRLAELEKQVNDDNKYPAEREIINKGIQELDFVLGEKL